MPNSAEGVEKVDDMTVRFVLNEPRRPSSPTWRWTSPRSCRPSTRIRCGRQARPRRSTSSRSAPGRSSWSTTRRTRSSATRPIPSIGRARRRSTTWSSRSRPDPAVRWQKLQAGECHVMPYPNPADLEAMRNHPDIQVLEQEGLNVGYLAFNTEKEPFTDKRCARRSTWRSTRRRSWTRCSRVPARSPRTRSRRPCGGTTTRSRTTPTTPHGAKGLLEQAGVKTCRPTSGRCRCSGPTIPMPGAWPS